MGDMSEDQERALEEFKKHIKDNNVVDHPQYDDYYLLRFLRARKFDMDKTKLMFHNFVDWRRENDVDNIIDVSTTKPIYSPIYYLRTFLLGIIGTYLNI